MNRAVIEENPQGSLDAPSFTDDGSGEGIVLPDGGSSPQGAGSDPSPQNLASERLRKENVDLKRRMADIEVKVTESAGQSDRLNRLTSFLDAVDGVRDGGQSVERLSLDSMPDQIDDPVGHRDYLDRYIQQEVQTGVQSGVDRGINTLRTETNNANIATEKDRTNQFSTDAFYGTDQGRIISDNGLQDDFREFVGNKFYGSGRNGAMTSQDLTQAYYAFRGENVVADAKRAGQRQVVTAFQNTANAQRPRTVAQDTPLEDLPAVDMAQELIAMAQTDPDAALALMDTLPNEKKAAILPYLPQSDY